MKLLVLRHHGICWIEEAINSTMGCGPRSRAAYAAKLFEPGQGRVLSPGGWLIVSGSYDETVRV